MFILVGFIKIIEFFFHLVNTYTNLSSKPCKIYIFQLKKGDHNGTMINPNWPMLFFAAAVKSQLKRQLSGSRGKTSLPEFN